MSKRCPLEDRALFGRPAGQGSFFIPWSILSPSVGLAQALRGVDQRGYHLG